MKRYNRVVLHGLVSIEKQDIITLTRLDESGQSIHEQTPVVEGLLRAGKTAPLNMASKHPLVMIGARAIETLTFTQVNGGAALLSTVYGWLRSQWQDEIVRSVVVVEMIVFHVAKDLRDIAKTHLSALRKGDHPAGPYNPKLFKSRPSVSGLDYHPNFVQLDGVFTLNVGQIAAIDVEHRTAILTGLIRTDAGVEPGGCHAVAAYGSLAEEITAFAAQAGRSFPVSLHGWLRHRWQDDVQLSSSVVAEQVIFHPSGMTPSKAPEK